METVLTDWVDISELRFDATTQRLLVVYRQGETRILAPVSQSGFDRFIGRPQLRADIAIKADREKPGFARRARGLCRSSLVLSTRLF